MPNQRPLRVSFETFGCRSNFADTTDLQAAVIERGAVACSGDTGADVYVINGCSVTDSAEKEAHKAIRKIQARSKDAHIIVTGCLGEVGKETLERLNLGDQIIGPGRRKTVVDAIFSKEREVLEKNEGQSEERRKKKDHFHSHSVHDPLSALITGPGTKLGEVKNRARFHLRVQEGCENSCTFCIIPQSRGGFSSKSLSTLLDDISHLQSVGYEEIVLTGTHLGGYGLDRGTNFVSLLREIVKHNPQLRFRLSSIDPNDLDDEILEVLSKSNVFCEHLHICVQAFSDRVLKRMNRRYRLSQVFELIEKIRSTFPHLGLGSDVIVGFPGETRAELDEAIEICRSLPFSYLHIFPYSERQGTAAVKLDGMVDERERRRRAGRFRAIGQELHAAFCRALIGKKVEMIAEAREQNLWLGTTREFVTAAVILNEARLSNEDSGITFGKRVLGKVVKYDESNQRVLCELLNQASYSQQAVPKSQGGNHLRPH